MSRTTFLGALLPLVWSLPLCAQDMIGVLFTGEVVRLRSTTGAVTLLATGQIGKNCLACSSDNRLWTTVRTGFSPATFQYFLANINPFTGAETLPFGNHNVGDIRALAANTTGSLFGIRDLNGPDELVRIDMQTGVVTVIGPTGFTGIQAFDNTSAGLRVWDQTAGLLLISAQSGLATDPFPRLGGPAGTRAAPCRHQPTTAWLAAETTAPNALKPGSNTIACWYSRSPASSGRAGTASAYCA